MNSKCKNCNNVLFANDMDPFPGTGTYPFHLPKLTIIEEMLIVKTHVIMAVYRLKKSGTVVYKGNVLNVQQDNYGLLKSILNPTYLLPRKILICLFFICGKIVEKTLRILRFFLYDVIILNYG